MKNYRFIVVLSFLMFSLFTINAQEWLIDVDEAKKQAEENNQVIILVFQGSDWCAPCMKLEQEIWKSEVFKNYANENYILLKADFPKRKKNKLSEEQQNKNDALAEKYNKQGHFPLVVILNSKGEVKGSMGYEKTTPEKYIEKLNSF